MVIKVGDTIAKTQARERTCRSVAYKAGGSGRSLVSSTVDTYERIHTLPLRLGDSIRGHLGVLQEQETLRGRLMAHQGP